MFWVYLPVAFLLAILVIYVSGEVTGKQFENLFRRLIIAIALLVAFPQISSVIQGVDNHLTNAFGGEQNISQIFDKIGDKAHDLKDGTGVSWLKVGQVGLTIIATLSFLVLSIVRHFLEVLHLVIWNLLHILGPLALLGCLFPTMSQMPKGIFLGMLEVSLWRPVWVILSRILTAIGFGEAPSDPSHWFDTAVMNFAVAGLMASTPALVHGFLSGALASVGGTAVQNMLAGTGAVMAAAPMRAIQLPGGEAKRHIASGVRNRVRKFFRPKPQAKQATNRQAKSNSK